MIFNASSNWVSDLYSKHHFPNNALYETSEWPCKAAAKPHHKGLQICSSYHIPTVEIG